MATNQQSGPVTYTCQRCGHSLSVTVGSWTCPDCGYAPRHGAD